MTNVLNKIVGSEWLSDFFFFVKDKDPISYSTLDIWLPRYLSVHTFSNYSRHQKVLQAHCQS